MKKILNVKMFLRGMFIIALLSVSNYNYCQSNTNTVTVTVKNVTLEEVLKNRSVKFVYLVPTFQNPTGRTLSLLRRKRVAEIIKKYQALLVEDDPYSALRYKGRDLPTIKSFAPENVVYVSTLSKVFAPGFRIGFHLAPEAFHKWFVIAKQGVDLHTNTYSQALASEYLSKGYLEKQLLKIVDLYKPKQLAMLKALDKYMPKGYTWSSPEGGMFLWVEGPQGVDMEKVNQACIKRKTAFVPGKFFFTDMREGASTMRLNYTMSDERQIDYAVNIIGDVLRNED